MRDDDPTNPHLSIEELLGTGASEEVLVEEPALDGKPDTGVLRLAEMVARASTAPPESPERFEVSSTDIPPPPPPPRRLPVIVPLAVVASLLVAAVAIVLVATESDRHEKRERIHRLSARIDEMAAPVRPPVAPATSALVEEAEEEAEEEVVEEVVPTPAEEPEVVEVVEEEEQPERKKLTRRQRRRRAWRRARARIRANEEVVVTAPAAAPTKTESGKPSGADIRRAMGPVGSRAQSCVSHAGGTVQLRVIVAGDGSVRSASALGPHRGTSTGRCVEQAARGARFDPFEGQFFTFTYPVTLR